MKAITKLTYTLFFLLIFISNRSEAQITLVNEEFGIKAYPKKKIDTITIAYVKDYPGYRMELYTEDYNGKSQFKLYNEKGKLRIKGQFTGGKDTLIKYTFSKTLGIPDGKSHKGVIKLKYVYLLESGMWFYYDDNLNIARKKEFEYKFFN